MIKINDLGIAIIATILLCIAGIYLGYYEDISNRTIVDIIIAPIFIINSSILLYIFKKNRKAGGR